MSNGLGMEPIQPLVEAFERAARYIDEIDRNSDLGAAIHFSVSLGAIGEGDRSRLSEFIDREQVNTPPFGRLYGLVATDKIAQSGLAGDGITEFFAAVARLSQEIGIEPALKPFAVIFKSGLLGMSVMVETPRLRKTRHELEAEMGAPQGLKNHP